MDDDSVITVIAVCVVAILFAAGFAIGHDQGIEDGKETVHKQIIEHGYGTYKDGKFKWEDK